MKFILFVIIGFVSCLFASCVDIEKTDQLARIDAMNKTLDSIETLFKENKINNMREISSNSFALENRIKNNYESDTINMELGRKMDAFKVMRKSLSPLSKASIAIKASIEEEREKLKELRDDIENGNGKRDKYNEYVTFEEQKVQQVCALLKDYVETKTKSLKTYDDLYEDLNAFSMSLLEK